MPTLSFFYGITIRMFWNDHPPPHFHAEYAEDMAVVDIQALRIIRGDLPRGAKSLVLQWATEHQAELLEAWEACSKQTPFRKIDPLP